MKNNNSNLLEEKFSLFTQKDFDEMKQNGATDEMIEDIKYACAFVDTASLMPKDLDKFFEKFDKVFPADVGKALEVWQTLPKTDPKFFRELVSLLECIQSVSLEKQTPAVQKVTSSDIENLEKQESEKAMQNLIIDFLSMSHEDRQRAIEEIKSGKLKL